MEKVYKEYTLNKINESTVGEEPFYHVYIEDILHEDLYKSLKDKSNYYHIEDKVYTLYYSNISRLISSLPFTAY